MGALIAAIPYLVCIGIYISKDDGIQKVKITDAPKVSLIKDTANSTKVEISNKSIKFEPINSKDGKRK